MGRKNLNLFWICDYEQEEATGCNAQCKTKCLANFEKSWLNKWHVFSSEEVFMSPVFNQKQICPCYFQTSFTQLVRGWRIGSRQQTSLIACFITSNGWCTILHTLMSVPKAVPVQNSAVLGSSKCSHSYLRAKAPRVPYVYQGLWYASGFWY